MKKFFMWALLLLTLAGCSKDSAPDAPVMDVTPVSEKIYKGESITLSPEVTADDAVTAYQWELDNAVVARTKSYVFTPSQAGVFVLKFTAANETGSLSKEYTVSVGLYKGGLYVINEGWYGHDPATVDYFTPTLSSREHAVYAAQNSTLTLGTTGCYMTQWKDSYFFVSKQGRRLVKASALTLKDEGEITVANLAETEPDGRSFAGVDENTGIYTTSAGAYVVNLNTKKADKFLENSAGSTDDTSLGKECGSVLVHGNYIYVLNVKGGVLVYKKSDYSFVKTLCKAKTGFAVTKGGKIVCANGATLYIINASTLDVTEKTLPSGVKVYNNSMAWSPSSLKASSTTEAIYFSNGSGWSVSNVHKYDLSSDTDTEFIVPPTGKYIYGAIAVDEQDNVLVNYCTKSWGDNNNTIALYDKTGTMKYSLDYEGYMFPSMVVINDHE